ncbi:MAG: hypothetical protein JWN87_2777 [Frankiales bacterium]|nr:hypothetical protein [Frankiales bacterium]
MRRLATVVVSTVLASGFAPLLPAAAAVAPGAPTAVGQYAAAGGVGLTWSAPAGDAPVAGYRVFRGGEQVAEVATASVLTVVDDAVVPSASADYTVQAFGEGGDGPLSEPVTATRPAADPSPGSTEALVVEGINRHTYYDAARAGDAVALSGATLTGTRAQNPTVSSTLPVVPGPGTWSTGPSGQRHMNMFIDGFTCNDVVGTLTVHEALFDAQLQPLTYAADWSGTCSGSPTTSSLRLHSGVDYAAALLSPAPLEQQALVGESTSADVTITNRGLAPLSIGSPAFSGPQAAAFSVTATTCAEPVAAAATCTVTVTFSPAANGSYAGSLDVPMGTPVSTHSVPLKATGGRVPSSIYPVLVDRVVGRNQLRWSAPTDLGVPANVSYRIQRDTGFGFETLAVTSALSWIDTAVTRDVGYMYRVTPFNDAGDGSSVDSPAAVGAAWSVLTVSDGPGVDAGLYLVSRISQLRVPFLADATARFTPTVSPDGAKVVYAQATVPGNPNSPTNLWMASLVGPPAPVQLTTLAGDEIEPTWSRDGLTLAFTSIVGDVVQVRTMPSAGGASVVRTTGSHPSWLADSTRLVVEDWDTGLLYVVDAAGKRTAVPGVTDGYMPAVSPDGLKIAYIKDDGLSVPRLAVVPVTGGASVVQSDSAAWDSPTWAADSHRIYGERIVSGSAPRLGLTAYNPDGYPIPEFNSAPGLDLSPVFVQQGVVHLTSAPKLTGSTATIKFGRPEVDQKSTCSLDGATPTDCAPVGVTSGSVTYTNLASGSHHVVISTEGGAAQLSPSVTSHSWTVDRTAPVNTIVAPAVGAVLTPTVTFSYRATDPSGVLSYDVRYRRATSNGAYSAYTSPSGWTNTTAATRVLAVTPGYEYCFSMRSRDKLGNVSAFTADRCVTAPLDDRSLVASAGWTRPGVSGAYRSTITSTTRTGTTLTVRAVQTRRIALVVTKCPSCGQVGVYLGTTRLAVVDTRAAGTTKQVRVNLPVLSSVRSGALVLKPLQAGRSVQIDGIAFGRS